MKTGDLIKEIRQENLRAIQTLIDYHKARIRDLERDLETLKKDIKNQNNLNLMPD